MAFAAKKDRVLRRRQVAWTPLFLLTVALALVGVAYAMVLDDVLACPTPGADSNWGRLSWSVLPPGPQYTFTEQLNGIERVGGPGPACRSGSLCSPG